MARNKLKALRVKMGLTQSDVAKKIGITTPNYCLLETGKRFGRPAVWAKLKEIFHIKDSDIYSIQNER